MKVNPISPEGVAESVKKLCREWPISSLIIQTKYGNHQLGVHEIWEHGGIIYISVDTEKPGEMP